MKLLLTGGRGLVGSPLARLLGADHEVVATDLPELDVTDPEAVGAALERHAPERVVHLAAWTDVDGCERDPARADSVNGGGTRAVAQACAARGVPLLYVSTDYVFDGRKPEPYVEEDAPAPLSAYGRSKLAGEHALRTLPGDWWIVRCQSIYGRGRKSFADAILARAESGEPLRVVTDQIVSPSYADDVAEAVAAVLLRAPPGVYHASNAGACTWYEFARAVLDAAGRGDTEIAPITASDLCRPAPRPANSQFSCARLERATGLALRDWRAALLAYLGRSGEGART